MSALGIASHLGSCRSYGSTMLDIRWLIDIGWGCHWPNGKQVQIDR